MHTKRWLSRVGAGISAGVFVGLMVGTLGGCGLLKPKEKKPFGNECVTDLDCESLSCSTTGNICSKTCTYDKDCGGELVCRRKTDGTGNWCSKALGAAPNEGCMFTDDCQHNSCLKYVGKDDQPGLCTKYCADEADCPAGMKICTKISDTGMLKVCLPGDPAAPASARPAFAPAAANPAAAKPGWVPPKPQPRPAQPARPPEVKRPDPPKPDDKAPAKGDPKHDKGDSKPDKRPARKK